MDDNINTPGWEILRGIEAFNQAARARIRDTQYKLEYRERLAKMRDQLNAIEIELHGLVS
jgi:hypothetical protein